MDEWMKPKRVPTDITNIGGSSEIHSDPLGVILIIGAWNYPVQLSLLPLVGCISAGNCALVKLPSDKYSKYASRTVKKLCEKYLDPRTVRCVEGDRYVTGACLDQKYDKMFFTGGSLVGKMVAAAAAKNLTPTVLELGGKKSYHS
eukprot:UN25046